MNNELERKYSELSRKLDELKAAGADKERGGEYDRVLAELRVVTAKRTNHLIIVA